MPMRMCDNMFGLAALERHDHVMRDSTYSMNLHIESNAQSQMVAYYPSAHSRMIIPVDLHAQVRDPDVSLQLLIEKSRSEMIHVNLHAQENDACGSLQLHSERNETGHMVGGSSRSKMIQVDLRSQVQDACESSQLHTESNERGHMAGGSSSGGENSRPKMIPVVLRDQVLDRCDSLQLHTESARFTLIKQQGR